MQVTKEMISILGDELYKLLSVGVARSDPKLAKASAIMLTRLFSNMWQPIETAPWDRTLILGYDPYYLMRVIKFDPLSGSWLTDLPFDVERGGRELRVEPTHWMPLPPAPETT